MGMSFKHRQLGGDSELLVVTDKVFNVIRSTDFVDAHHDSLKALQIGWGCVRHSPAVDGVITHSLDNILS